MTDKINMLKTTQKTVIAVQDWDALVTKIYGRPYKLQQQDGCMARGQISILVPDNTEDYPRDEIPEIVNHDEMGVSFKAWLGRDPKTPLKGQKYDYQLSLWWNRNFYPDLAVIANDLHAKGLIPAGEYIIDIDW